MRRQVLFLLSPRLIDFDTWLPVAFALATARRDRQVRFVAFDRAAIAQIDATPLFAEALAEAGIELVCLDAGGRPGRLLRRALGGLRLLVWLLCAPRPALIHGRPYAEGVYRLLRRLCHLRGGKAVVMLKTRAPDHLFAHLGSNRIEADAGPGRDADAIVYYHEEQSSMLADLARHGRIAGVPRHCVGLPQALPPWRAFIAGRVAALRARLGGGPVMAVIAGKSYTRTLRAEDSVSLALARLLAGLARLRPGIRVLIRPHPLEDKFPYIADAIAAAPGVGAEITGLQSELLIAVADRVFFNSPTNLLFSGFHGRFIDCSDYPADELAKTGPRSQGHGALYLPPRADDFDHRLAELLASDDAFLAPSEAEAPVPDAEALLRHIDAQAA